MTFMLWNCIAVPLRDVSQKKNHKTNIFGTMLTGSHLIVLVQKIH